MTTIKQMVDLLHYNVEIVLVLNGLSEDLFKLIVVSAYIFRT